MPLPELVVDLREEHELLENRLVSPGNRLVSPSETYEIINIPSRHIFANVDWISKQTEKRPVWLICASGRRSQAIKEQYFGRNDGIKSSEGGMKLLGGNKDGKGRENVSVDPSRIEVQSGTGGYGIQQIMQMMFALMISVITISIFFGLKREYLLLMCGAMLAGVVGQLVTKSCLLGKLVPKHEFIVANVNVKPAIHKE
jgi:rhodanese-related sulfurtransferase